MSVIFRDSRKAEVRKIALDLYLEMFKGAMLLKDMTSADVTDEMLKNAGCWNDAENAIDEMLAGEC